MPNWIDVADGVGGNDNLIVSPLAKHRPGEYVSVRKVVWYPWEEPEVEKVRVKFADEEKHSYRPEELVDLPELITMVKDMDQQITRNEQRAAQNREAEILRNIELIRAGYIPIHEIKYLVMSDMNVEWSSHLDQTMTLASVGSDSGRVYHEGRLTLEIGAHGDDQGKYINAISAALRG